MVYNKTVWKSGETPLSAQNFNNMENGIEGLYKGENEVEFENGDTEDGPVKSVEVELLESGETNKTIIQKISNMFRNVRYLLKLIGDTDISGLSEEKTVTGALAQLNGNLKKYVKIGNFEADNIEVEPNAFKTIIFNDTQRTDGYSRVIMTASFENATSDGFGSSFCSLYNTSLSYNTKHSAITVRNLNTTKIVIKAKCKILYVDATNIAFQ